MPVPRALLQHAHQALPQVCVHQPVWYQVNHGSPLIRRDEAAEAVDDGTQFHVGSMLNPAAEDLQQSGRLFQEL